MVAVRIRMRRRRPAGSRAASADATSPRLSRVARPTAANRPMTVPSLPERTSCARSARRWTRRERSPIRGSARANRSDVVAPVVSVRPGHLAAAWRPCRRHRNDRHDRHPLWPPFHDVHGAFGDGGSVPASGLAGGRASRRTLTNASLSLGASYRLDWAGAAARPSAQCEADALTGRHGTGERAPIAASAGASSSGTSKPTRGGRRWSSATR
jgi:hypothetical protein